VRGPRRSPPPARHVAAAHQYCQDVLAGRIPACLWIRLACERQLRDLERERTDPSWPYRLDAEQAERVCDFVELMPHIKGPLARLPNDDPNRLIRLEPWQCFALVAVYGWVHRAGKFAGKRRFRQAYLEVPRGNAKSTLLAGLGLYALAADGEAGAEVYSAATTRDQAKIVFGAARRMALKSRGLLRELGVGVHVHAITRERTASTFQPLSAEDHTLEGLNVHFVAIDELHAHRTRAVYDVIETGAGKRDQPLMWVITTSGTNRAGICYEVRTYLTKILQQLAPDETVFGLIYSIDDADDWTLEDTWRKANPNWGISVDPAHVARLAAKAMQMPSAQPTFLTKHLDVWVNADTSWMDMRAWDRCAQPELSIEEFKGQPCKVGLDLASKTDLAAKVKIYKREQEGLDHFYAFGTYYVPQAAIDEARNAQYAGWEATERLVVTPGDVIDIDQIELDLIEDAKHGPIELAYDPWQATQLAQHLQAQGVPTIEFRNTVANFSAPMKEIDALVRTGRWHHDGDPALAWMISNVVCHVDAKENIYPRKERPENKIDGPVAAIMAMGRHLVDNSGKSFWDR